MENMAPVGNNGEHKSDISAILCGQAWSALFLMGRHCLLSPLWASAVSRIPQGQAFLPFPRARHAFHYSLWANEGSILPLGKSSLG